MANIERAHGIKNIKKEKERKGEIVKAISKLYLEQLNQVMFTNQFLSPSLSPIHLFLVDDFGSVPHPKLSWDKHIKTLFLLS